LNSLHNTCKVHSGQISFPLSIFMARWYHCIHNKREDIYI